MLRVEQISASYGNIKVLHQVNLQIETGQIVTVLGANGAGKSTLLKTISGIVKTNDGSVVFQGRDITNRSYVEIVKLGISHVPEGREIFPQLKVKENLLLGAYHRKNHREIERDMENIYGIFPILGKRMDQLAGTLSGGEQQMLAICRAFMARPKLLMLDEPSLGLAPIVVSEIFQVIRKMNETGTTILLIEQNVHQALQLADYGYVMENGRVMLRGSTEELLHNETIKKLYLGES